MYHSYVMGIDESIYTLENQGFEINRDGGNFMVSFQEEKAWIWEEFISAHLELEYWNTVFLHDFPDEELLNMIDQAYDTVFSKFSKKEQKRMLEEL